MFWTKNFSVLNLYQAESSVTSLGAGEIRCCVEWSETHFGFGIFEIRMKFCYHKQATNPAVLTHRHHSENHSRSGATKKLISNVVFVVLHWKGSRTSSIRESLTLAN